MYRRPVVAGAVLSVLVHLAIFLLWQVNPISLGTSIAAGPRTGDPVAAAGGGAMRSMRYRLPEKIEVPPPPEKFVVDERPIELELPEDPQIATLDLSTALGEAR